MKAVHGGRVTAPPNYICNSECRLHVAAVTTQPNDSPIRINGTNCGDFFLIARINSTSYVDVGEANCVSQPALRVDISAVDSAYKA
jgi:hypothetical protein